MFKIYQMECEINVKRMSNWWIQGTHNGFVYEK